MKGKSVNGSKDLGLGFWKTVQNNFWALRFIWSISRNYVVNAFINEAIGYFMWVFFSAYFIRYIVQAVTGGKPVSGVYIYRGRGGCYGCTECIPILCWQGSPAAYGCEAVSENLFCFVQ